MGQRFDLMTLKPSCEVAFERGSAGQADGLSRPYGDLDRHAATCGVYDALTALVWQESPPDREAGGAARAAR
jgi:hypothetical protein